LAIENKSASDIFGFPDDLKLKSCMTLFVLIQKENPVFQKVLDKYFKGKISWKTKQIFENYK
jgi:uncharacterized protein (DUF1810 family)